MNHSGYLKSSKLSWKFFFIGFGLILTIGLFLSFLGGNKHESQTGNGYENKRENKLGLTEKWAKVRSSHVVSPVKYHIKIDFSDTKKQFAGEVTTWFKLTSLSVPLTFDFRRGVVNFVKVNGKEVSFEYNGDFITVSNKNLVQGKNRVLINFKHDYMTKGIGLSRIEDPEDGRVYFYTEFEPYDANRMFPCFDQPDIKASYELEVKSPREWEVISTVMETSKHPSGKGMMDWKFPETQVFSTYVFSLHAGPFKKWVYEGPSFVPLRLFARKSMAKYVRIDDWFPVTAKGLNFFNDHFQYSYPFEKYDQVIVPGRGAMENVGAVIFPESFVKRGPKTQTERERLASIIYHEMAHMWFGNLVTMKWWNGLWLNESFASYMAFLAMEKLGFSGPWVGFNGGMKKWAYWADQLVTTHPIESSVLDTSVALSNFDGISYGKGGAVLKQLEFYIGPEKFREGLRIYFQTHEFKNTELKDFIKSMEKSYGRSLDSWKRVWLETSGVNAVEVQWSCENGQMTPLTLLQTASPESLVIRPHRMNIALFKRQDDSLVVFKNQNVTYDQANQVFNEFSGLSCPDLVFPNYGDHDFVKVKFDPVSLKTLMTGMAFIEDPLSRQMAGLALWEMVRDGDLSLHKYANLMMEVLSKEKDIMLIQRFVGIFEGGDSSIFSYLDGLEGKEEILKKYSTLTWKRAQMASPGSDEQLLWGRAYIDGASSPMDMRRLEDLLVGKVQLSRLKWSPDLRWQILRTMSAQNYVNASALIKKEKAKDTSHRGKLRYIATQVVRPELEVKMDWFRKTTQKDSTLSAREISTVYRNLFSEGQNHLRKLFLETFINQLPKVIKGREDHFLRKIARLTPVACNRRSSELITQFLNKSSQWPDHVVRGLKISRQENDRCVRVREGS